MTRRKYVSALLALWYTIAGCMNQGLALNGNHKKMTRPSGRDEIPEEAIMPPNIVASEAMKHIIDSMLKRSPTFRRQCRLLGDAKYLRIRIEIVCPGRFAYRARSTVLRFEDGAVSINMQLVAPSDYVEVIGHEFEHAIEQAEGLDLKSLAACPGAKVYKMDDGYFETERAVHAGVAVSDEYRRKPGVLSGEPGR